VAISRWAWLSNQNWARLSRSLVASLLIDGIDVDDEHVKQADRQAQGQTADQQPQEHRPRPPVLDQRQMKGEQLRVQPREERQREELGVHGRSAGIRPPILLISDSIDFTPRGRPRHHPNGVKDGGGRGEATPAFRVKGFEFF
jgi:hypothetical protein